MIMLCYDYEAVEANEHKKNKLFIHTYFAMTRNNETYRKCHIEWTAVSKYNVL